MFFNYTSYLSRVKENQQQNKALNSMENKKGINWFFAFIAFILGLTLFKHIDFANFSLQDPILDVLYLIVFALSIYFMLKGNKPPEK
jgi:nicotinamide riboside transporter PnuC